MKPFQASWMIGSLYKGLILLGLMAVATAQAQTNKSYEAHVLEVQKRAPAGFTVLIERPFIVVGNEAPAMVREHAENTIRWAVNRLKKDFFSRDPVEIIDIWLFKDKASYNRYTKELFNDTPTTPFGYYSAQHHALIMNIETGGGTLVHEIVHPFMAANFPGCPAWFNEGMGSLFEQCEDRDGHIRGLTNWRLPRLQESIKSNTLPSFEKLLSTTTDEFYGGSGNYSQNYGQARYLCYYLQEKGLLPKFYLEFTSTAKQDKTGLTALRKVLGTDDLKQFQKAWEFFVLRLKQ
jgi:hypothetical protein